MYRIRNKRVVVLIDAENIEIQAHNEYNAKVDHQKILQTIRQENIVRAIYFAPSYKLPKFQEQQLVNLGYEVKVTPKNVDCWLTISAVTLAPKCDVVVLMAGDSDFLSLLWYLSSRGVKTIVWSWPQSTSKELKALADEYWLMTDEFLLNKKNNVISLTANRRK